jgi:hypothetical protein
VGKEGGVEGACFLLLKRGLLTTIWQCGRTSRLPRGSCAVFPERAERERSDTRINKVSLKTSAATSKQRSTSDVDRHVRVNDLALRSTVWTNVLLKSF